MKVVLIGQDYAISAEKKYLMQLRDLPDRRYDPTTGLWRAPFVVENYEYMISLGWPIEKLGTPTRSMLVVEGLLVGTNSVLVIKGPNNHAFNAKFKGCPTYHMYSMRYKGWAVMPTEASVDFVKKTFPSATWNDSANELLKKMYAMVERSAKLNETKTELAKNAPTEPLDFKFKTKPYAHQLTGFMLSREEEAFALLMEQGTGKTKVTIDTAAWLRSKNKINAILIGCPNDVKDVWVEEMQVHMPEWCEYEVVIDGQTKPADMEAFIAKKSPDKVKVLITNCEGFASTIRTEYFKKFLALHDVMMVLDEVTRFKNPTAKRTKAMLKIGKSAKYRRILTGTPVTQNPLDVYAPFRFLDPYILGYSSYSVMRNTHAILGGWQGKQVMGFTGVEEIKKKIAPFSYRVLRADCVDLPDKIYQKHHITLSTEQRKLYDEIRDQLVSELAEGMRVSAPHALVKMLRLSQITGGFVKTDVVIPPNVEPDSPEWNELVAEQDGRKPIAIPGANPKLSTTLEIIEDLPEKRKVVIWARFRAEIEQIAQSLSSEYGEQSVVTFYGGVDRAERTVRRRRFQGAADQAHDPECQFFVAQVDTGSVGLTLTQADTVIYYSNSYSLETRLQSEDRTHRIGQKKSVTYHDLIARNTIDEVLIQALRRKKSFADLITGDAWRTWL